MSKKLSCPPTVMLEDPNAATARELRRMYNRPQQRSIVQAIRSKLRQYEAAISGRSKPPLTSTRKGSRAAHIEATKSLEISKKLFQHEPLLSAKLTKRKKDVSVSLKISRDKPRAGKHKPTKEHPPWRGTFPVSPISELTLFTTEGERFSPDMQIPWNQPQRVPTEDDELIDLVRSYKGSIRQPSALSRHRKDQSLETKVIRIQRYWRSYRTKKLIETYMNLLRSHNSSTTEGTSMTASYEVYGQLEENMPRDLERGRIGYFRQEPPEENPEDEAVVVAEPHQSDSELGLPIGFENASQASPKMQSEGIVFIDEDASLSEKSTHLLAQIGEETGTRTPKERRSPLLTDSQGRKCEGDEEVVIPGFAITGEQRPTPKKEEQPQIETLRTNQTSVEEGTTKSNAQLEITALHRLPLLKFNELPHLIKLYQDMIASKYKEQIDFLDDQLDAGIIDTKEYDSQVATTQRWRKLKEQQLASYHSNFNRLSNDTESFIGELFLQRNLKKRSGKYLTSSLSDQALPLNTASLRKFDQQTHRKHLSQKGLGINRQKEPVHDFLATPHKKLPERSNSESPQQDDRIIADCEKLTQNLVVEALQECFKSSYIKLKLKKLAGRANISRGIRTDEVMVESFVKKLIEYMLSQPIYIKHFSRLKTPAAWQVQDVLKNFRRFEVMKMPTLEPIMPEEALTTMNQMILARIPIEKQLDDPSLEADRVGFIKSLIEIHNTAMFDALNDELDRQRASRPKSAIFASQKPHIRKSNFSISNSICKAQQAVIEDHRICCGVHPEKLFKQGPQNQSFLQAIRFERLSKDMLNDMDQQLDTESVHCDTEQLSYRLQLAELVAASLLGEFLSQLHTLL